MSLLTEIQESLLQEGDSLASSLLKMRFLASRLGSEPLEEWIKYEAEGYPVEVDIPPYRKFNARYIATFTGAFGREVRNAPIPTPIVAQIAGESWNFYPCRESVRAAESILKANTKEMVINFDASNLMLLLEGRVYENMACNSVRGQFPTSKLSTLLETVRARILELCIKLEKDVPAAAEITTRTKMDDETKKQAPAVSSIVYQTIHGDYTHIANTGDHSTFNVTVEKGSPGSVLDMLRANGFPEQDAVDFAEILKSEGPTSKADPFGEKAKGWINSNLSKALNGTWKIALPVATSLLTAAAEHFYGLK